MVHHDKPTSLSGLQKLSQAIDARYWECHAEISHETTTSGTSSNRSESKSDKMDHKSNKGSSQSKQKNTTSGSLQSKGSTMEAKKTPPNLSSKLGKDRKLMPQEQQHHLDKNLCLFCGNSGHVAKDCPKSSSASSKARASKTAQDSAPASSDSKNS